MGRRNALRRAAEVLSLQIVPSCAVVCGSAGRLRRSLSILPLATSMARSIVRPGGLPSGDLVAGEHRIALPGSQS